MYKQYIDLLVLLLKKEPTLQEFYQVNLLELILSDISIQKIKLIPISLIDLIVMPKILAGV